MENPKNIEAITILITESRTDFSLPYLVYTTKITRAMMPIKRKIHAKSHKVKDANSTICNNHFFFSTIKI
jgi:hypothetical protein